jgi:hypothetical protein
MKKNNLYKFLFLAIFLLGFMVRFIYLGRIPDSLYWDEVAILTDARVIAETGQDMHNLNGFSLIRPSYGDFKLNIYILITSFIVKFLGVSNFSLRFVSFLAGVGNLILIYFFVKKLFINNKNKKLIALFSMLALAISPWSILFSRTGFESHLACFFFNLSFYFLVSFNKIKIKNIFLSVFFAILATYTYYSVRFIWPFVFFVYFIIRVFILQRKTIKTFFVYFFKYFFGPLLIYFCSLLIFSKDNFYNDFQNIRLSTNSVLNSINRSEINTLRSWSGDNFFSKLIFNHKTIFLTKLAQNYAKNISFDFLFFHGDPNLRHSTGEHGLFLFSMIFPFLLGIIFLAKNNFKNFIFLLLWWIFSLLPASVPNNVPHALRSLNAIFPLSIFIGYGFFIIFLWQKKEAPRLVKIFKNLALGAYLFLIIFTFSEFCFFYFGNYRKNSSESWQYGYKQLVEKIKSEKNDVHKINIIDFDDRFYLWYLAFSDIGAEEIQNLKGSNFRFSNIENINFNFKNWDDLNNEFSSLVICPNNNCEGKINSLNKKVKRKEELKFSSKISDKIFYFYYF